MLSHDTWFVCVSFAAETALQEQNKHLQGRIRQAKLPVLKQTLHSSWQAGDRLFGLEQAARAKEAAQARAQKAEHDVQQLKQQSDEERKKAAQQTEEIKQQAEAELAKATALKVEAEEGRAHILRELSNVQGEVLVLQRELNSQCQIVGSMAADGLKWKEEATRYEQQYQEAASQSMLLTNAFAHSELAHTELSIASFCMTTWFDCCLQN